MDKLQSVPRGDGLLWAKAMDEGGGDGASGPSLAHAGTAIFGDVLEAIPILKAVDKGLS